MAKLSDLLSTREITANQTNLEKGKVWTITNTDQYACVLEDIGFCWQSPGCGTATIEVWGAGGSSAKQCCCSVSMPGNAPAYSKKTIAVFPESNVIAYAGLPCKNDSLCFRGCSQDSRVVWENARDLCGNTRGCMCSQGGISSHAFCLGDGGPGYSSPFCCYKDCGFCFTQITTGSDTGRCGIICNFGRRCLSGGTSGTGDCICLASAFGGDINKQGLFSKMDFRHQNATCNCWFTQYIPYAAGVFSEDAGYIVSNMGGDYPGYNWSGAGMGMMTQAVTSMSSNPNGGMAFMPCNNVNACGCYEATGCTHVLAFGLAAPAGQPCGSVRDHAYPGGMGAVRITYRGTNSTEKNCRRGSV
jgi:hypothetical protein